MERKTARATALLPVSFKASIELCSFIRQAPLDRAIDALEKVASQKLPVPYRAHTAPHKAGIGPGRFPVKAASAIRKLLVEAKRNAAYTGMGEDLVIEKLVANRPGKAMHYGRRRRRMKQARVEVVVREAEKAEAQGAKGTQAKAAKVNSRKDKANPGGKK